MRCWRLFAKIKAYLPLYAWAFLALALLSGGIYLVAVLSPTFAAWFNGSVGHAMRTALAALTAWIPFSLAELLLYLLPFLLAFVARHAWRHYAETWGQTLRFFCIILTACSLFFSTFVLSFGTGYHTEALDKRLSLSAGEIDAAALEATAAALVSELNTLAPTIEYGADGFSKMPATVAEMNDKLLTAYDRVSLEYPFIRTMKSRVKTVAASRLMSYTHITGVYTYFTGEANLNTHFPDYTLPFTAAHEMAHQRGIARENEASFVAFLACTASEEPYIRYAGYLNLYEYVTAVLYHADKEAHFALLKTLHPAVLGELRAYDAFFEEFADAPMADLSDAVNDTFLKLNGNEAGTASYGLVVELAVAYYRK